MSESGDRFETCEHSRACARMAEIARLSIWYSNSKSFVESVSDAMMCRMCEEFQRRAETVEPRTCKRFFIGADMICSECGHQLNDPTANYCKTCGAKVVSG